MLKRTFLISLCIIIATITIYIIGFYIKKSPYEKWGVKDLESEILYLLNNNIDTTTSHITSEGFIDFDKKRGIKGLQLGRKVNAINQSTPFDIYGKDTLIHISTKINTFMDTNYVHDLNKCFDDRYKKDYEAQLKYTTEHTFLEVKILNREIIWFKITNLNSKQLRLYDVFTRSSVHKQEFFSEYEKSAQFGFYYYDYKQGKLKTNYPLLFSEYKNYTHIWESKDVIITENYSHAFPANTRAQHDVTFSLKDLAEKYDKIMLLINLEKEKLKLEKERLKQNENKYKDSVETLQKMIKKSKDF